MAPKHTNIEFIQGNLLQAQVEALVNTVNCVGVMGKGIAFQFAEKFHQNTSVYKAACKAHTLHPGGLLVVELQLELENQLPRFIINFATKDHWRSQTQLKWIEEGLQKLVVEVRERGISSIAIPALGCGNGGLDWNLVRPLIETAFQELSEVRVLVFPPNGAPNASDIEHLSKAPNMTPEAALMVKLISEYSVLDLEFSQLEVQKLSYLLQQSGYPMLRLHFEKMQYGPAAREWYPRLRNWEGHWTVGFGDGTGGSREPISLRPEIVEKAHKFLESNSNPDGEKHLQDVLDLIEGFDTALGLELLASVHWIARHHPKAAHDVNEAIRYIHQWNPRKEDMFPARFIELAWARLDEKGWLKNLKPEWMRSVESEQDAIRVVLPTGKSRAEVSHHFGVAPPLVVR
ncbi:MAG: Appr-1-p processing protein [Pedobacter sp.]|nr:MAG: Appr-1-p processing protein [Pedobacter sp.]